MNYSKIKNHIINKRNYWYYYIIIFISLIFAFFSYYGNILTLLLFWLSIISIASILINYYRCRSFVKFYNNYFKKYNPQFNRILIEKEAYKIQPLYKSYDATIQPSPKLTNVVYLETDDFILLFFSIRYLNVFQLVLKPFIFVKPDKEFCAKNKGINIIQKFKIFETEQYRTIIFPNKDGIKKVIIPFNKYPF